MGRTGACGTACLGGRGAGPYPVQPLERGFCAGPRWTISTYAQTGPVAIFGAAIGSRRLRLLEVRAVVKPGAFWKGGRHNRACHYRLSGFPG